MGWMNLNDYLVIEAAAAARRQDLMNAGRRFPESQSWVVTVVVLAVSALVIGSGGCASSETTPGASPSHELRPFAVGWEGFSRSTGNEESGGVGQS